MKFSKQVFVYNLINLSVITIGTITILIPFASISDEDTLAIIVMAKLFVVFISYGLIKGNMKQLIKWINNNNQNLFTANRLQLSIEEKRRELYRYTYFFPTKEKRGNVDYLIEDLISDSLPELNVSYNLYKLDVRKSGTVLPYFKLDGLILALEFKDIYFCDQVVYYSQKRADLTEFKGAQWRAKNSDEFNNYYLFYNQLASDERQMIIDWIGILHSLFQDENKVVAWFENNKLYYYIDHKRGYMTKVRLFETANRIEKITSLQHKQAYKLNQLLLQFTDYANRQ